MTDERDQLIEDLFAQDEPVPADDAFAARVMAEVDRAARRRRLGQIGTAVIAMLALVLGAGLLRDAAALLVTGLGQPLIDVEQVWFAQIVAPVNTVGTVCILLLLGFWVLRRRLFS